MKVYFIRHGETLYNADHKAQGWCDVKLSENGIAQAKALGENIKNIRFDRIIASDLERTKQTARLIFGDNADIEFDERIREIDNTVISGKKVSDLLTEYGEQYEYGRTYIDYSAFGGESRDSLLKRTADFLDSLKADSESEKIAVVTHGGTLCAILSNVLGCTITTKMLHAKNCSVTVLEQKKSGWYLDAYNYKYERLT